MKIWQVILGFIWIFRPKPQQEITTPSPAPSDMDVEELVWKIRKDRARVLDLCSGDVELAEMTWKRVLADVEKDWPESIIAEAETRLALFDQGQFPAGSLPHLLVKDSLGAGKTRVVVLPPGCSAPRRPRIMARPPS